MTIKLLAKEEIEETASRKPEIADCADNGLQRADPRCGMLACNDEGIHCGDKRAIEQRPASQDLLRPMLVHYR